MHISGIKVTLADTLTSLYNMQMQKLLSAFLTSILLFFVAFGTVSANHSWGGYHWARTQNPFTLNLGDNMNSSWDPYLVTASSDWNASSVLDTQIVTGGGRKNCRPTSGRVEVCNGKYGNNGWLGLAQIWVSGVHITQGTAKMNDTYFNTPSHNIPAWKRMVVCQEVAHDFGLDHQDENFNNSNLGTCMDYTSDPDGPPSNEHPNQHDFDMLETIYAHLDSFTTLSQSLGQTARQAANLVSDDPGQWGRVVKDNGKVAVFERDFGFGVKVFTFVIWAE